MDLSVIAIIGILSAVVLASLSTSRQKANDAKIEEQMNSFRNAAGEYYTLNNNFGSGSGNDICSVGSTDTTGLYTLEQGGAFPPNTGPLGCSTDAGAGPATQWSAYYGLSSGSFFCVDSTGVATTEPSTWTAPTGGAPCP